MTSKIQPSRRQGFLLLHIGPNHDPTAEICDNQIDDTGDGRVDCDDEDCEGTLTCREETPGKVEVFVMSECPFARKALSAMKEVLSTFEEEISFRVHYIATKDGDGFKALHGQSEVDENIRQLCAARHYPTGYKYMEYIWCRNKDMSSDDWGSCAVEAGMTISTMRYCADGGEGKKLLREDIKIGVALGVSASPTWFANNKHKFSGIDAKTIRMNICKHNPLLKGCKEEQ